MARGLAPLAVTFRRTLLPLGAPPRHGPGNPVVPLLLRLFRHTRTDSYRRVSPGVGSLEDAADVLSPPQSSATCPCSSLSQQRIVAQHPSFFCTAACRRCGSSSSASPAAVAGLRRPPSPRRYGHPLMPALVGLRWGPPPTTTNLPERGIAERSARSGRTFPRTRTDVEARRATKPSRDVRRYGERPASLSPPTGARLLAAHSSGCVPEQRAYV